MSENIPAQGETWRAKGGRQPANVPSNVIIKTSAKERPFSKEDKKKPVTQYSSPAKATSKQLTKPKPKSAAKEKPSATKQDLQLQSSPNMVCIDTGSRRICFQPPPHYLNIGYYPSPPPLGYAFQSPSYLSPHMPRCVPPPPLSKPVTEPKAKSEKAPSNAPSSVARSENTKSNMTNNTFSPPSIRSGANYLFYRDHSELHIFTKAAEIWSKKYQGQQLEYKEFKVATNFTVKNVIERIVAKDAEKADWAASEVIEVGGGEWRQGVTIEYASDKAKGQLVDIGWDSKRGKELPPVWLCIHKINKD